MGTATTYLASGVDRSDRHPEEGHDTTSKFQWLPGLNLIIKDRTGLSWYRYRNLPQSVFIFFLSDGIRSKRRFIPGTVLTRTIETERSKSDPCLGRKCKSREVSKSTNREGCQQTPLLSVLLETLNSDEKRGKL